MTPEEKSLLERTCKMVEENNSILRGIRRSNRLSSIMRILYWTVIIVTGVAAYYFIQPYVTLLSGLYDQASNGISSAQNGLDTVSNAANSLKDLLR